MKKIKTFLDKYFLYHISNRFPSVFRFYSQLYEIFFEIYNFIKYRDKYFFHAVSFEISTYCNRKCWYCPNKDNETPKEYMSLEIFHHAVEELKKLKFSGSIIYNIYGEPLFDERLEYFVQYIKDNLPNATSLLISNGDILNIDRAKSLLHAGMDKFIITVHDKNPERNLERLKPVKEFLKEKMILQVSSDLQLVNRGGIVDISNAKNKFNAKKCPSIKNIQIKRNGDIILCCHDYYAKYVMGNIMKDSIVNIYNSYRNLRIRLLRDNIADLEICKKCLERE
ncbi:radical SAM/SPASM domain-containing protein [Brachyspira hyodysenteriae]|uniref:radical SAM/SPASM domain-containing protein n=2 Tax=Brachyspira hyodysenteriae TaxID=159 RepID=UPI001183E5E2|nr:radical SAM/SPASM domain-containing protein [Brachyspira hyodysenteriae]MBT8720403.1 radical SAM/SPASM domain-containing protein [Brachyspira hyodysenteriae]MBT8730716.1 radical SAM/SPASM domain-containing protein [Brachyspira hyodysenteriae]MBT8732990.1 radical SAM/SPASM domain-containing protein [Brachyspira hyodysenteriae]MBT8735843.1 radical SAM/SPASM domain-containing protein [Brachyspira hyodysenteriae]MBT8738463.1 radical SAM/SPASM domain-containing protein [Brachyspira hyodysenteria